MLNSIKNIDYTKKENQTFKHWKLVTTGNQTKYSE
jgi:hypothetical protein